MLHPDETALMRVSFLWAIRSAPQKVVTQVRVASLRFITCMLVLNMFLCIPSRLYVGTFKIDARQNEIIIVIVNIIIIIIG